MFAVLLRLFGTMIHVLVISTDHRGWLGDPWELRPPTTRSQTNQPRCAALRAWSALVAWCARARRWLWWHGDNDDAIVGIYKMQLRGDDEKHNRLFAFVRRESLFLHIAGNFGFALVLLSAVLLLSASWSCIPIAHSLSRWPSLGILFATGCIAIIGHYKHARAIRLLLRAAYDE